ncbi:MAG: chromate transporter [Lachnospiraceae bacterium]|nr:chromate transporter [Lachnospiraceae bacterium]
MGAFTFGGGYAMISLIENICVEQKKWITHDEMMDIIVIAESTPGPVAINCATYVGYKTNKMKGAVVSTIGMVLPSFVIIFLISMFLNHFLEIKWVANAFHGIKIAVGILILDAAIKMIQKMKKTAFEIIILMIAFAMMMLINIFSWNISTTVLLLAAAVVGLASMPFQTEKCANSIDQNMVDEKSIDEKLINEKLIEEKAITENLIDKKVIDKMDINKSAVDKKLINENAINGKAMNENAIDKEVRN